MSSRARHTTSSPRRHGRHQEVEQEATTPRRSARPYNYSSAVSPGRGAESEDFSAVVKRRGGDSAVRRHRDGAASPAAAGPEENNQYPGDAALRRQSTQRPGGRRSSIDPDRYRRPSPVRPRSSAAPRVASPARSPRRERDAPVGEARHASSRRRHRDGSSVPAEARPASRTRRSKSRPESAIRTHRSTHEKEDEPTRDRHRHGSRHRSRSRRTGDESRHRSRSRRHDSALRPERESSTKHHISQPQPQPQPTTRQDTGRYISPPDPRGHATAFAAEPLPGSSSDRHTARHRLDPVALSTSSRPPMPRTAPARDLEDSQPTVNGSHMLQPPTFSSPRRQRSGSHIEVLSVSSLHGYGHAPSYQSPGGPGSDMYVNTPLAAPSQRPRASRPYISPSPNQPSDILEERIEETKEWMEKLKQQVARDRAMEQAEAAIAAADVDHFLAGLRRADSITAPSEMDEPQRLYWRAASRTKARDETRPAATTTFRDAPRATAALEARSERRHQSTRRRERESVTPPPPPEPVAAAQSSRCDAHEDGIQRSHSTQKERSAKKSKKPTRSHTRDRHAERDEQAPRPRHSSTRRRRADTETEAMTDDSLAPGRATSVHPPPPGVPASRTSSQAAWQSMPAQLEPTPASRSESAVSAVEKPAEAIASSQPSRTHTRQSSRRSAPAQPEETAAVASKSRPAPTPSDVATTASEDALESEASPAPKPVPQPDGSERGAPSADDNGVASSTNPTEDLAGEAESEDVFFLSFLDGSRFLSTDELCQYNVFMAESLSDGHLDLVRERVFDQDDVAFAEVLYGDDIQAELAQIEALLRDAAARSRRPLAEVEDEIWEDQKAAIKRFNAKAAVAMEGVQNCGTDLVEALESAAVAYREQQLQMNDV